MQWGGSLPLPTSYRVRGTAQQPYCVLLLPTPISNPTACSCSQRPSATLLCAPAPNAHQQPYCVLLLSTPISNPTACSCSQRPSHERLFPRGPDPQPISADDLGPIEKI
ncbi:hypothetical protein MDA_GLEAN10013712 [Myotis davidii]|uniref:Uncharacterized protein n=1 Tax=Myotis davidii TaxID=225400 RepID=L5MGS6_MYODS|nr:hypothetical protein MDA_GLEAN10013712 [Myotis davidii]